jgi:hypothetical protein
MQAAVLDCTKGKCNAQCSRLKGEVAFPRFECEVSCVGGGGGNCSAGLPCCCWCLHRPSALFLPLRYLAIMRVDGMEDVNKYKQATQGTFGKACILLSCSRSILGFASVPLANNDMRSRRLGEGFWTAEAATWHRDSEPVGVCCISPPRPQKGPDITTVVSVVLWSVEEL